MFKDNTFLPNKLYCCPICGTEFTGYNLMFHLVKEHELDKDVNFNEEANRICKEMPQNMLIMAKPAVLNAAILASVLGQETLMKYIINKHIKEIGVIKNISI